MAILNITPEDQLKGKVIPPGVYLVEVHSVEEGIAGPNAKYPGSQTFNVCFKITDGEFKGVQLYKTFSETAPGYATPFAEACGAKLNPKENYPLDFHKTIKTKLKVVNKNKMFDGNMKNEISGFMPL